MKAFDLACTVPWAIREESLQLILDIARRCHDNPEAVSSVTGKKLENTRAVTTIGSTAVIPISGPIFRYANLFSEISGATSVEILAKDFRAALDNEDITSIVLNIDSPGGEVNGIDQFSSMVYEARDKKEIVAFIDGTGASAAYWIASAASKIFAAETAIVGSIGVIAAMRKQDDPNEVVFVSSDSPKKKVDIETKSGKEQVQEWVDDTADVFIDHVARNRSVSRETVINDFGQGGCFVGVHAVDAGLIDGIGSFDNIVANLQPAPIVKGGSSIMDANAILAKIKEALGETPVNPTTADITTTIPAPAVVTDAVVDNKVKKDESKVDDSELAKLRAENQRLLLERYQAEAAMHVSEYINDGRAFPAERESMIALFVQAAQDDATLGTLTEGMSRVKMLKAVFDARPTHLLTAESIGLQVREVINANAAKPAEGDPLDEDGVNRLLQLTPMGQARYQEKVNGRKG